MKITLALCLMAALALCEHARAESTAPLIVLVSGEQDHPLLVQLKDELTALGLELRAVAPLAGQPELAQLARQHSAAAVVVVDERAAQIVISVGPEAAGGARGELVIAHPAGAAAEPNLLALRAVELLRGLLLPVEKRERSPADAPADPQATRPAAAPAPASNAGKSQPVRPARAGVDAPSRGTAPERPASLLLAPALAWSPGGVEAAFGLRLAAEYRFAGWLGFEASALLPAGATQADARGGALDVRLLAVGSALRASTELAKQLSVGGGAGIAALSTRWERTTSAPTPDLQDEAWTALPYMEAGGTFWLHPVAGIRADALAGWSTSVVELEAEPRADLPADATAGASSTFGRPLLLVSLGFELRL